MLEDAPVINQVFLALFSYFFLFLFRSMVINVRAGSNDNGVMD